MDTAALERVLNRSGFVWYRAEGGWRISGLVNNQALTIELAVMGALAQLRYRFGVAAQLDLDSLVYLLDLNDQLYLFKLSIAADSGVHLGLHWPTADLEVEVLQSLLGQMIESAAFLEPQLLQALG